MLCNTPAASVYIRIRPLEYIYKHFIITFPVLGACQNNSTIGDPLEGLAGETNCAWEETIEKLL